MKFSNLTRKLLPITFCAILTISFFRCTKDSKQSQNVTIQKITSSAQLSQVMNGIAADLKNGVLVASLEMKQGASPAREQSDCIAGGVLKGSSFVMYENGNCSTIGTYSSNMKFQIGFGAGTSLLNPNSLSPLITLTYSDGTPPYTFVPTLVWLGQSGAANLNSYTVQKFSTPNYCNILTLTLTLNPSVRCTDGQTYTGTMSLVTNIASQRSDACLSIAPFFVQTLGQPHQISVAGFSNPCFNNSFTPCISFPDKGTFFYRTLGSTTWTNSLNIPIYNGGAYLITGLASGTYEYYTVGAKSTTPSCTQQPSEIKTITVL